MRRTTRKTALVALCLAALAVAQATVLRGLVLCRAPGQHVAIEDVFSAARCHGDVSQDDPNETRVSTAPLRCVDTPLLTAIQVTDRTQQIAVALSYFFAAIPVAILPTSRPEKLHPVDLQTAFANRSALRLLRSVILIV